MHQITVKVNVAYGYNYHWFLKEMKYSKILYNLLGFLPPKKEQIKQLVF